MLVFLFLCLIGSCYSQTVTTLAGSGSIGATDGVGTNARFYYPSGVAVDSNGNVYAVDQYNHKIRKITPAGSVTTLAGSTQGSTDAVGAKAQFNSPFGVAIDSSGILYVGDRNNHKIRKIASDGNVTTVAGSTAGSADGVGTNAQFYNPTGVTIDSNGNLYVADNGNHRIRKITPTGSVSTLAGGTFSGGIDAVGTNSRFGSPTGIAVDSSGNVYVADNGLSKIRKITPSGSVTTFAGSGTLGSTDAVGTNAQFYYPIGIAIDSSGILYVGDSSNCKIRVINEIGTVFTLAGNGAAGSTDGAGTSAQFNRPYGVAVDSSGNVYVADQNNNRIRKIIPLLNCQPGTFLSSDSGQCASCSPGTYSNVTNSPNCTACPAGTYAASSGSTNCTICPEGFYCPSDGLVNAIFCPENKYCLQPGLIQPIECLAGTFLYASNSSNCSDCPVGSFCPTED